MTTDIVTRPAGVGGMSGGEIDTLVRLAQNLAASGFFKDAKKGEEAFAKLVFGRDLGLGATQALTEIHIVEGKPELSANLQASMVRRYVGPDGERYDFRKPVHTNTECKLVFRIRERGGQWEEIGESEFSIEDAKLAGLVRPRSPWEKYPRNMLFARAMSNGVAWYCPEVTGGVRVYSPGEIGADPDPTPEQVVEAAVRDTLAEPEVPDAEVVEEPVTVSDELADLIVSAVIDTGIENLLPLSLGHVTGRDFGELGSPEDMVAAVRTLTLAEAERIQKWIADKQPADAEVTA